MIWETRHFRGNVKNTLYHLQAVVYNRPYLVPAAETLSFPIRVWFEFKLGRKEANIQIRYVDDPPKHLYKHCPRMHQPSYLAAWQHPTLKLLTQKKHCRC